MVATMLHDNPQLHGIAPCAYDRHGNYKITGHFVTLDRALVLWFGLPYPAGRAR